MDNFGGAAHYPGMKLALRLPPVCLRSREQERDGEVEKESAVEKK